MTSPILQSKEQVVRAFQALLAERKEAKAKIATKEELALRAQEKELVAKATGYTSDNIVKELANLQLDLGNSIESLATQLDNELQRLDDLRKSIEIQQNHYKQVLDTQVAADALYILNQEQIAWLQTHEAEKKQIFTDLEKQITQKRAEWEREQAEYALLQTEMLEALKTDRDKELALYKYELERLYRIEADQYEEKKKMAEREIAETDLLKNKDWQKREKALELQQAKLAEYKKRVEGYEEELKQATQKAREEAIKETSKEVKNRAELLEKEVEGKKQTYELQIVSLENTIAKNTEQIEKLTTELKEALAQVQSLSLKVVEKIKAEK
ncbi:MAG: hypothetical protein EAZ95_11830 [Bacteroidetes bacterium]|nr:MAG: hypothetical protein EAZ95_11830 [Bacteroidota bacterium]